MQEQARRRKPWDWRGQLIQLSLITLVGATSGGIAYLAAVIVAYLVSGGPPPVPDGWQNTVVFGVAFAVFFPLLIAGMSWTARYLRKNRGRML
jgi:sterol desaturase/sphingolipid hydroxylase (fatty acid hydroxylase superfamily)